MNNDFTVFFLGETSNDNIGWIEVCRHENKAL